jgi:hypothetical protein
MSAPNNGMLIGENAKAVPCLDCPGEDTQKMDTYFFNDLLNSYRNDLNGISENKTKLSTIGDRTLTKKREYQIANNLYLRDLAQIERLKMTVIYLLACIVILCLIVVSILPTTLGYVLLGGTLVAYILHVVFINNNFHKRYNLNYALFQFKPEMQEASEAGSVLKCEYVPA